MTTSRTLSLSGSRSNSRTVSETASTPVVSPVVFGLALDRGGYSLAFPTLAAGAVLGLISVGALVQLRDR